jgi:hypothetical protein
MFVSACPRCCLRAGSKINKSIKSLWDGSKLVDDNARLLKENDYARRQVCMCADAYMCVHASELQTGVRGRISIPGSCKLSVYMPVKPSTPHPYLCAHAYLRLSSDSSPSPSLCPCFLCVSQVDLKAQHLTELKFNLDQLKEMYDGTQQLVLHEGSALSSILAQKENEAKHLQQQRNKVQVCKRID